MFGAVNAAMSGRSLAVGWLERTSSSTTEYRYRIQRFSQGGIPRPKFYFQCTNLCAYRIICSLARVSGGHYNGRTVLDYLGADEWPSHFDDAECMFQNRGALWIVHAPHGANFHDTGRP